MQQLDEYIVILKDIVPSDLCNKIIDEYKECNQWAKASTRKGDEDMHRNCESIALSIQSSEYRQKLDYELYNVTVQCLEAYNKKFKWALVDEDTGYDLLRYKEGQYYKEHTDSFIHEPRLISCSFHLNDDYEGGEFAFFGRKLKYKLNKGDVLMFPSTFMYPHEVMPVTKGTRYSIITWFR
jgi:predicted 2-oxoglutarate/Fe(II)-dependent dioxygenase YbiX